MTTATTPFSLFGLRRVRPAPIEVDAADMGTCFGLEMSFDRAPAGDAAARVPPERPAWWQRLGAYRSTPG